MRLKDADKLIELLEAARAPYTAPILNGVIKVINDMPTAYDVDKVVEELQEQSYCDIDEENYDNGYFMIDTDKAINIVKRGGIK